MPCCIFSRSSWAESFFGAGSRGKGGRKLLVRLPEEFGKEQDLFYRQDLRLFQGFGGALAVRVKEAHENPPYPR